MFQTLQVEVYRPIEEDWFNIGEYVSSVNVNKGEVSALGTDSAADGIAQSCDISLKNGTQERLNPTLQKGKIEFVQEEQVSISSSGTEFSLSNSNLRNINIFVQKTDTQLGDIDVSISEDNTKAIFSSTLEVGDTVYVSYTYLDKIADNPFNIHSGQYVPLLWENRLIRINSINDNSPRVHTQTIEADDTTFEYATEFPSKYEILPGTIKLTHIQGIPWNEFTSNWDTYLDVFNSYTREELQDFVSQNITLTDSGDIKFLVAPPNEDIEVMYQLVDKSDTRLLFEGYIDNISFDFGNIDINCLGKAKRLQEAYINPGTLREYEVIPSTTTVTDIREGIDHSPGIPMEIFIQNCLDDAFGAGEITFYTETDPDFSILDIAQNIVEYKTIWELLQDISVARACFIGYLYNSVTGAYELTFKDIDRTGTESADHTVTWTDDMTKHNMDIDGSTLRNHIIVRYWDTETGGQEEVAAVRYDRVVAISVSVTKGSYTVTSSGIESHFSAGDYVILAESNTDVDIDTSLDENLIYGKQILVKRIQSVSTDTLNLVSQIPFTEDLMGIYTIGDNISNNGLRPARIEEEKSSLITREDEAKLFAKKLYLDTSKIFNLTNITTFVRHEIQPLDVVSVVDPNMETDTNGDTGEKYYIESVKHSFDFSGGSYTTTMQGNSLRGRAGRQKLQTIQSRPGEWTPITSKKLGEFEILTAPENLTNTTGGLIAQTMTPRAYVELKWDKPRNSTRGLYYVLEWRESSTASDYSQGGERIINNVQNLSNISERIEIEPNKDYNWRVTAYSLTNKKGVASEEQEFSSVEYAGNVLAIRTQEEFEEWINSIPSEDYLLPQYKELVFYEKETPYTYTMDSWFTPTGIGEVKSGELSKLYITDGDITLYEEGDYIRVNSEIREIDSIDDINDIIIVVNSFSGSYTGNFEYQNAFKGLQYGNLSVTGIGDVNIEVTLNRVWDGNSYGAPQYFLVLYGNVTTYRNVNLKLTEDSSSNSSTVTYGLLFIEREISTEIIGDVTTATDTNRIDITSGDENYFDKGDIIYIDDLSRKIIDIDDTNHYVYVDEDFSSDISSKELYELPSGKINIKNSEFNYESVGSLDFSGALFLFSKGNIQVEIDSNKFKEFPYGDIEFYGKFNSGISGGEDIVVKNTLCSNYSLYNEAGLKFQCRAENISILDNTFENKYIRFLNSTSYDYVRWVNISNNKFKLKKLTGGSSVYFEKYLIAFEYYTGNLIKCKFEGNQLQNELLDNSDYFKDCIMIKVGIFNQELNSGDNVSVTKDSNIVSGISDTSALSVGQVIKVARSYHTVKEITDANSIKVYSDFSYTFSGYTIYIKNNSYTSDFEDTFVRNNLADAKNNTESIITFISDNTGTNLIEENNFSD